MSEKEQAGSKAGLVTHEDDSERRFWCRVVRKCIPKLGMARSVEAADLAVLALRERSVASDLHPATGSAFEQLVREYRALEKQRDDIARETLACFRATVGLPEHQGTLKATVIAMRQALERQRAELEARRTEVERLRLAVRGIASEIPTKKDR